MIQTVNIFDLYEYPEEEIKLKYTKQVYKLKLPSCCPCCSGGMTPKALSGYLTEPEETDSQFIFAVFLCPLCGRPFMASYPVDNGYEYLTLRQLIPARSIKPEHSENIRILSPSFCKIYNEAYQAEQQGLFEICGMGYRKALEFLVKDFAISRFPKDSEDIKRKMLGQCINDYIENTKLKALAKASSWIGNDETHYVRRNADHGLKDLKSLISAAASFIDMELEVEKAEALMNN